MTKDNVKNIAASVRQKLLNIARKTDRPFQELLQYYAMERFLYRLSQSPHAEKFVLKGALMLIVWEAPYSRPTLDIDLLGNIDNSVNVIEDIIKDVCHQQVEPDGIAYKVASINGERIVEDADYEGVRVRFLAFLDKTRITMQVDIGFGDIVLPSTQSVKYPTLLDLPAPELKGYSKESAIAEKFEVMVKLGILNSRMKDFYDIWLMSRQYDFDGNKLSEAIKGTFDNRRTNIPMNPFVFTDEFNTDPDKAKQWQAFLRKNRIENAPEDFGDIISAIAIFLKPIVNALLAGRAFDLFWNCSGNWSST